jgi:hypothetical protein
MTLSTESDLWVFTAEKLLTRILKMVYNYGLRVFILHFTPFLSIFRRIAHLHVECVMDAKHPHAWNYFACSSLKG